MKPDWYLEDPVFSKIWDQVQPYTMTSVERGYALYNAVKYIVEKDIKGNIVESGVWRGGSAMLIALTLLELNSTERELYLFDTYAGMTKPSDVDIDLHGNSATAQLADSKGPKESSAIWAYASLPDVKTNMALTAYPTDKLHFVEGNVRVTAPQINTRSLALLRLDTDWYASTKSELNNFWHRLNSNGILIVDDYGHWQGAKKAVDEFFLAQEAAGHPPVFLQAIDYTGRLALKTEAITNVQWRNRYDHFPEQLNCPDLSALFPYSQNTNPATCKDKRLRREVPHIWRTDTREKPNRTGNVSTEEAALLYAFAQSKSGCRGIEIGSHFGWSTAHLLEGGLRLDAIDPAFSNSQRFGQVSESLQKWVDTETLTLWPGYSPQIVPAVSATSNEPYSLAFIDGNHDNEGPLLDTKAVIPHLTDDAFIIFHDLTFTDVTAAVQYLKGQGWNIRVYNTMQIMAVAWKHGPAPVDYAGDPTHGVALPTHIQQLNADTVHDRVRRPTKAA